MSAYKRGSIAAVAEPGQFYDFIEQGAGGCWEWVGPKNAKGYGQLRIEGVHLLAHRYSVALHRGELPPGMVLHRCDNKPCVNPDHLYVGDASANALDTVERGQHANARKTHCIRGHEFTPENTRLVGRRRRCRRCERHRARIARIGTRTGTPALRSSRAATPGSPQFERETGGEGGIRTHDQGQPDDGFQD